MIFSGSYSPEDVIFLLDPSAQTTSLTLTQKEQAIQQGQHYSQFLSPELLPEPEYLHYFHDALTHTKSELATGCVRLAQVIAAQYKNHPEIVLVSLARAGTPFGILIKKLLPQFFSGKIIHYSVSIMREKGIDPAALRFILTQGHAATNLCFIDGWTGKGGIARTLRQSIAIFNQNEGTQIVGRLYVISDLAGVADYAPFFTDQLIPSCLLNATVSGLISRTVCFPTSHPDKFHQCVYYSEWAQYDYSAIFIREILQHIQNLETESLIPEWLPNNNQSQRIQASLLACIQAYQQRYAITKAAWIKIGIGETTRALLRRVPRALVVRDKTTISVAHLCWLATKRQVPILVESTLPCEALAILASNLPILI